MLRLISYITLAIAVLYGLEKIGVIPEREYFPKLPRLEGFNQEVSEEDAHHTAEVTRPIKASSSFTERVTDQQSTSPTDHRLTK